MLVEIFKHNIMPNYYELGRGGQFTPEAINRRRSEAAGTPVVLNTKKDLIAALVDKASARGENISQSQIRRWERLTISDLQKLNGHEEAPKKTVVKTETNTKEK